MLFGAIDTRGSRAIKAFTMTDVHEWIRHFHILFEFIDAQKIRTPTSSAPLHGITLAPQSGHCQLGTGRRSTLGGRLPEIAVIFAAHERCQMSQVITKEVILSTIHL